MHYRQCLLVALLALASSSVMAFPGQLDATFGTNGVVNTQVTVTGFQSSSGGAGGVVRQPDGKVVLAGSTGGFSQPSKFALVRFNPDGTFDSSFGSEGRVNGGPGNAYASGVLLDAVGRIVVVGSTRDTPTGVARFALARFLPDGTPDATFGSGGSVSTTLPGENSEATAARFDASGRIVVVGQTGSVTLLATSYAVARYTPDGALDTTFGQAGLFTTSFPPSTGGAKDVAIDGSGRIVVAGTGGVFAALVRLLGDGSLDASFGGTGKVSLALTLPTSAGAVALDGTGRIVVAGQVIVPGSPTPEMAVFRLLDSGALDNSFGAGGVASFGFGGTASNYGNAVRVDGAGRILVAGSTSGTDSSFAFARVLDNGTLDATFGTGGRVTLPGSSVNDLAPGDAGSHYWAGSAQGSLVLGSILDSGAQNPAFNGGNFVSPPATVASGNASETTWNALDLAAGGKIVAAGRVAGPGGDQVVVTRREADGAADATFAMTGVVVTRVGGGESRADAVLVDGSDRVVIAGSAIRAGYRQFALVRLLPDGQRDAAFGTNGEVVTPFGSATDESAARALARDASGRLVAGGYVNGLVGGIRRVRFALARYLADGSPDPSFGTGGQVIVDTGSGLAGIRAIALDANGRIVAVGDADNVGAPVLARFTPAGVLDAGFGAGGVVPLDTFGALGLPGIARAVAIDSLGRIVVGGAAPIGLGSSAPAIKVLRFDDGGAPDTTFGTAGGQLITLAGAGVEAHAIAIDASARIVAAGNDSTRIHMVRLAGNGSPDTSFGIGSVMPTSIGGPTPLAQAMRLLSDGRAVVAGRTGSGAFIARFAMASPPGMQSLSIVRNGPGSVASSLAGLDCGSACVTDVPTGTIVTLAATASAGWRFDGWSGDCSGAGPCTVTVDAPRSVMANFSQVIATAGQFANLSTRMAVQLGDNVLIGGFVIGGDTPRTVVVRARGPSLAPFGLANTLPNPRMSLFAGQTVIASNDDWASGPDAAAIQSAGLAPSEASESALRATLAPGGYTVVVEGVPAVVGGVPMTGTGIVEVFNPDPSNGALVNISTRGLVQTGNDVMIAGFVIQGAVPQTVVVRARGPSLAGFGIVNPLSNPFLQVFSGPDEIARNDNWQSGSMASQVQALGLQPPDFRESAVHLTLAPGAYTAIVSGLSASPGGAPGTGVAIVEVFAVTPLPP